MERQSGTSEVTPRNEAQAVDYKLDLFNWFPNIYFKLLTKKNMDCKREIKDQDKG